MRLLKIVLRKKMRTSITFDKCPKHDVKIITGDMHAKVGKEAVYRKLVGKHSLHDISYGNGKKLNKFADSKDLIIGSTMFDRKNIHKLTWILPDGETKNHIYHLLID